MRRIILVLCTVFAAGCINVFWRTEPRVVPPAASGDAATFIRSSLKVHLKDGGVVIFRNGATVQHDAISGSGAHFRLFDDVSTPRERVPMDSVVGVEAFDGKVNGGTTVAVSLAATAAGVFGSALLAVAIFGSCPTVYADSAGHETLQAEGFSYAVAPLMEHRDVDGLRVRAGADGRVRLELRNEALETHHINHVELIRVHHRAGEQVVPDQGSRPVVAGEYGRVTRAVDRAGRDVRAVLAARDGALFATDDRTVRAARVGDLDDWIDLEVDGLPPGDSVAVVLRLRNSLLNTILLYEGMLGGRDGADWLVSGLSEIATAVDVGRWYTRTMGMRALVDGATPAGPGLGTARLGDVGPVAFRDVALVLPRAAGARPGTTRVRLQFVADNWRIDEVRVAGTVRRPAVELLPVDSVIVPVPSRGLSPVLDVAAARAVADADESYLETRPGQRMTLVFAGPARGSSERAGDASDTLTTHLLAWQGWYREWIRASWLAAPTRTTPFVPGDAAMLTAITRWRERKSGFEREFYASRIPVK